MKRRNLLGALLLVILFVVAAVLVRHKPPRYNGALIQPPQPMPDFTLGSAQGPVRLNDLRGRLVVLYFGYTSCPDICPTTLANLSIAVRSLGDQADQVQVVFVSVDHQRDTPQVVTDYAHRFRPDFIGLAGSQAQIDQVTRDYGIYYQLNTPDPQTGFYSVDHSATVLVLDRQGNLLLTWPNGTQATDMLSDLRGLIKN
jgi:protein SCO1/2